VLPRELAQARAAAPEHGTIKRGTLGSILRQAGLTPAEFMKLLD
jgi:hypothetical protein